MSSRTDLLNEPKTNMCGASEPHNPTTEEELTPNTSVNYCILINSVITGQLSVVVSLKSKVRNLYPMCLALAITHAKWDVFNYLLEIVEYIPQNAPIAAVRTSSTYAIRELVKAGYNIDSDGVACVRLAVENNDVNMVKELITLGTSLTVWSISLLEMAVALGSIDMVRLLIKNNAPVSLSDMVEVSKRVHDSRMEDFLVSIQDGVNGGLV